MLYKEAQEMLCQLMPDSHVHDPRLRRSVRSLYLAVEVPRSNLVSHARSFLPSTAKLWNSLPAQIPAIRPRANFSREVNRILCATSSAASEWFSISAIKAQLCYVIKSLYRFGTKCANHIELSQIVATFEQPLTCIIFELNQSIVSFIYFPLHYNFPFFDPPYTNIFYLENDSTY